jgi:hypothetical protein
MELIWTINDWCQHWCHYFDLKQSGLNKSHASKRFRQVLLVPSLVPREVAPVAKNYFQDNF